MEQLNSEQPELPNELKYAIVINYPDSLLSAIKLATAFSQCSHESRDLVHSEYFILQLAAKHQANKSLIALLLGNYTLLEYKEKKALLEKYKETTELINNDLYYCKNDEESFISNLKHRMVGILILLKFKLPYDKNRGLKTAIKEDQGPMVEFLLDSLKTPCDVNQTLLKATRYVSCNVIPILIKRTDITTLENNGADLIIRLINFYLLNVLNDTSIIQSKPVSTIIYALNYLINESGITFKKELYDITLSLARTYKQNEIAEFLIKNGATQSFKMKNGWAVDHTINL